MNMNFKRLSSIELVSIALVILAMVFAISRSSLFIDTPANEQANRKQLATNNTISARWNEDAARKVKRAQLSKKVTSTKPVKEPDSSEQSSLLSDLLTPEAILSYLSETRLDSEGKIVFDDRTLSYLRSSLNQISTKLDEDDKRYLHEVLSQGIGGTEGIKVADIVINFYEYQEVKKELMSEAMASNNLLANPEALGNINSRIEALQNSYFDAGVVDQLFYKENMDTRFSYELHALQQNSALNNAQKRSAYHQLQKKYHQIQPPIPQWEYKKSLFGQEKSILLQQNTMLQSEELASELQKALQRHFSERELLVMKDYQIDLINPSEETENLVHTLFADEVEIEPVATAEVQTESN